METEIGQKGSRNTPDQMERHNIEKTTGFQWMTLPNMATAKGGGYDDDDDNDEDGECSSTSSKHHEQLAP